MSFVVQCRTRNNLTIPKIHSGLNTVYDQCVVTLFRDSNILLNRTISLGSIFIIYIADFASCSIVIPTSIDRDIAIILKELISLCHLVELIYYGTICSF